jgi:hypothetical protein
VIAGFDVEGDRPPAPQDLVVWMGGDDEDAPMEVVAVAAAISRFVNCMGGCIHDVSAREVFSEAPPQTAEWRDR